MTQTRTQKSSPSRVGPVRPIVSDRASRRVLLSLLFLTPLVFIFNLRSTFDLPKLALTATAVLFLMARQLPIFFSAAGGRWEKNNLDVPVGIFMVWMAISGWFSMDRSLSFWGQYSIYVFGFFPTIIFGSLFFLASQNRSEKALEDAATVCRRAAALVAAYAVLQYVGLELFERMPKIEGGRVWSSLGNPIYMGAVLLMALPLGVEKYAAASDIFDRLASGLFILLALAGVVISQSRGVWLGAIITAVYGALIFYRRKNSPPEVSRVVKAFFVLAVAGVFVMLLFRQSLFPRLQSMASLRDGSNAARVEGWKAGFRVWKKNPVTGSGPDTFFQAFRPERGLAYIQATGGSSVTQAHAHNDVVQMAATLGTVGVGIYGALVFFILKKAWLVLKNPADFSSTEIAWIASILGLGIQNQFNFSSVSTHVWAAVVLGLLMKRPEPSRWAFRKWFPAAVWAGWIFLVGIFWFGVVKPVVADALYSQGVTARSVQSGETSYRMFRDAASWNPSVDVYNSDWSNAARDLARFDEAWTVAQNIVRKHPYNPDAWNNQGVAAMWMTQLAGKNELATAKRSFEKAIELDPVFVDAYANLAKWYHVAGDIPAERNVWKKVLSLDSAHAMARNVLAQPESYGQK